MFEIKLGRNVFVMLSVTDCDMLDVVLHFLELSKKYLANTTFRTSLAFEMSVLERVEKALFCQI